MENKHIIITEEDEKMVRAIHNAQMKEWAKKNPDKLKAIRQRVYQKNKEKIKENVRKFSAWEKMEVIKHYSNGTMACANPYGEHKEEYTTMDALSIDHIQGGGGRKHIKKIRKALHRWLRTTGYPEGYQVLCMNCQWIKRHKNKEWSFNKDRLFPVRKGVPQMLGVLPLPNMDDRYERKNFENSQANA